MPVLGWVLVGLSLAYAGLIHHGVGATGNGPIVHWWQPRGTFFTYESLDSLLAQPLLATVVFAIPALFLFLAVAVTTRSAIASTLALAALGLVLLCCFYGLGGNRRGVWSFFGWRGSGVMALFSLAIAMALLAPFLTRRWLEHGWPARLGLYVPIAIVAMITIRDVTGTDPTLPFAISPWPVISMFGIEIGGAGIAALLGMLGLGSAAAGFLARRRIVPGIVCAVLAVTIPAGVFVLHLGLGTSLLALVIAAAVVQLLMARDDAHAGGGVAALLPAARPLTLGAALVALPILGGQLLVEHDYDATRNLQAKKILDALDHYYARESVYPDTLTELVEAKDLDTVPNPQIGFGVFEEPSFTYQNFGTNYLLEFSAPRWVQCAYNPPYPDEAGGSFLGALAGGDAEQHVTTASDPAPGDAGEDAGEPTPGSWTCPQKPPELW
jgi:hypothetical protein